MSDKYLETVINDLAEQYTPGVVVAEVQRSLFDAADRTFDGQTYDPAQDRSRLSAQVVRVFNLMADGHWRTLDLIGAATGDPPASVSARLRDIRKRRFGGHRVERRRVPGGRGLWEYRLLTDGPLLSGKDRSNDPPAISCPTCGQRVKP